MSAGHEHARAALKRALAAINELIRKELDEYGAHPYSGRVRGLVAARDRVNVELSVVHEWIDVEHARARREALEAHSRVMEDRR